MIPATVSASLAFVLPVATPPNAIAFSYGIIKVYEMVRNEHFAKHHDVCKATLPQHHNLALNCQSFVLSVSCSPSQAATGLVVNILCIAVLTASLNTIAQPIFFLSSFPEWAQPINGSTNTSFVC